MKRFSLQVLLLISGVYFAPLTAMHYMQSYFSHLSKDHHAHTTREELEENRKIQQERAYIDPLMVDIVLENAPEEIKKHILRLERLLKEGDLRNYHECLHHITVIEGASGVGKTTMAKAFAHKMNRPVLLLNALEVLNSNDGSFALNLFQIIENALKKDPKIVIILDDLDKIIDCENRGQKIPAHIPFGLSPILDWYENNKNVLFVITTATSNYFDSSLLSRLESHTYILKKPNEQARKQAFTYLVKKNVTAQLVDESCLQQLAYNSNDYTYDMIKELVDAIFMYALAAKKTTVTFEEIKKIMKIRRFYHALQPHFRGCDYTWSEKTTTEKILCTTPHLLYALLTALYK